MIDDEQLKLAIDRIARTADGELLYRYLQKTLMGVLAEHGPADCALRTEHGRRRFAADLMAMMAKGIDESGGRSDTDTGGKSSERTVIFRAREPVAVRRTAGSPYAEWARANDPELQRLTAATEPGKS